MKIGRVVIGKFDGGDVDEGRVKFFVGNRNIGVRWSLDRIWRNGELENDFFVGKMFYGGFDAGAEGI